MKTDTDAPVKQAVLFELETVAANGHAILYDVLKKALAAKGIDLTGALFARFCLNAPLATCVARVLAQQGKKQFSADKLSDEVRIAYRKALTSGEKCSAGFRELLEKASAKQMALGAVSCLGAEEADGIAKHLELESLGVVVQASELEYGRCVTCDEWLRCADALGVRPLAAVALTSNSASCKAALAAGMHVVVRPGKYADFSDFSGANLVVDELDRKNHAEILQLPEPGTWL